MDEFSRRYAQTLFERDYPPPPIDVEPEAKPAAPEKGSRQRAQENAPGMDAAAMGLISTLAGALKGATAATIGLPGDVESLVRLLTGGTQVLPTTEDMQEKLPPIGPKEKKLSAPETMGEFLPVAPLAIAAKVGRLIKYGVDGKRVSTEAVAASEGAGKIIKYDARGKREAEATR